MRIAVKKAYKFVYSQAISQNQAFVSVSKASIVILNDLVMAFSCELHLHCSKLTPDSSNIYRSILSTDTESSQRPISKSFACYTPLNELIALVFASVISFLSFMASHLNPLFIFIIVQSISRCIKKGTNS